MFNVILIEASLIGRSPWGLVVLIIQLGLGSNHPKNGWSSVTRKSLGAWGFQPQRVVHSLLIEGQRILVQNFTSLTCTVAPLITWLLFRKNRVAAWFNCLQPRQYSPDLHCGFRNVFCSSLRRHSFHFCAISYAHCRENKSNLGDSKSAKLNN